MSRWGTQRVKAAKAVVRHAWRVRDAVAVRQERDPIGDRSDVRKARRLAAAGSGLSVLTNGSVAAEVYTDGYSVPANQVPPAPATSTGTQLSQQQ